MFCLWQERLYWSPLLQCYNCYDFHHFHRTAQGKFHHQEHLITTRDHAPNHVTITTAWTDHSLFITDTVWENDVMGQGHSTNLNAAEAPATTRDMHPTPYPTTAAAHDTHPPTDTLGDTLVRTPNTGTATTHP